MKKDHKSLDVGYYQTEVWFDGQVMEGVIKDKTNDLDVLFEIKCFFDGFRHFVPKFQDHHVEISEFILHLAFIDQCQKDWNVIQHE